MRRTLAVLLILIAAAATVSACGSKTVTDTVNGHAVTRTVANVHFPKTKFLLHAGLAFGAFHRYIYKPFKSQGFSAGAPKRKRTIAKAIASAAFVYHELKEAEKDALASDTLRRHLAEPLATALGKLQDLPALLKAGSFGGIAGLNGAFGSLKTAAQAAGANISDR